MSTQHDDWIDYLYETADRLHDHADAWCTLGQALAANGEPHAALPALERALLINPRYVEAAIARCFVLGDLGEAAKGYAEFRRLSAATFHSFAVVFGLGVFCMRHHWTDTGLAQLRRAQRIRPEAAFVGLFYAAALDAIGEAPAAELERRNAVRAWSQLLAECGGPEPAPGPIDLAFARGWPAPGHARLHAERAKWGLMRERSEDAAHELRLANARYPGHAPLLVETGRLCALQGRAADAEGWFGVAIAVDEACHEGHLELGYVLAEDGRLDEACDQMFEAVELAPLFPDYRYELGTLLLDIGRTAEAVDQLGQALVLEPRHGHAALQLAVALLALGERDEALRILETSACKDWPEALVQAAEIVAKDRPADARGFLERALARDPGHDDARRALEQLVV